MTELTAQANLRPGRVDLTFSRTAAFERPNMRLVRRRSGYPESIDDGLVLFDLVELFDSPNVPWHRIERTRYLLTNTLAEGGIRQAELFYYYRLDAGNPPSPVLVRVLVLIYHYNNNNVPTSVWDFSAVTQVTTTVGATAEFAEVTTVEIYQGALAATVTLYSQSLDGVTPDRVEFDTPTLIVPVTRYFDVIDHEIVEGTLDSTSGESLTSSFVTTTPNDEGRLSLVFTESTSTDTGESTWTLDIGDQKPSEHRAESPPSGLLAATNYYYVLYSQDPVAPPETPTWKTDPSWKASVMATGSHGSGDKLYELLPAIHRYYDEPEGQLRRYLGVLGAVLDQARSTGEGLLARHDLYELRAEELRYLGDWIGWSTDRSLPARQQRQDILRAREVYDTVGTLPNIAALIRHETGWSVTVKEFYANVFLTNDSSPIRRWDIWSATDSGTGLENFSPVLSSAPESPRYEGRPAAVLDGTGGLWLFWHSDASGRRELWTSWPDISSPADIVLSTTLDPVSDPSMADESPATVFDGNEIWLFWSSNRAGTWDIWACRYSSVAGDPRVISAAERITNHTKEDRCPAAVVDQTGKIHLFFESNRRGMFDIWMMTRDAVTGEWTTPTRVTDGSSLHDQNPAAIIYQNQIHLFWSRDTGSRSTIHHSILSGADWTDSEIVSYAAGNGPLDRHGSPTAATHGGNLYAFWHSNRGGRFSLWFSGFDGNSWSSPVQVHASPSAEKDPAIIIDSLGATRLFWRSQELGKLTRSHTFDPNTETSSFIGQPEDWLRYTYGADEGGSRYRREMVGFYIDPDWSNAGDLTEEQAEEQVQRLKAFMQPFLPVTMRIRWFLLLMGGEWKPV